MIKAGSRVRYTWTEDERLFPRQYRVLMDDGGYGIFLPEELEEL